MSVIDNPCEYHAGIAKLRAAGYPVKAECPGDGEARNDCRACRKAVARFEMQAARERAKDVDRVLERGSRYREGRD